MSSEDPDLAAQRARIREVRAREDRALDRVVEQELEEARTTALQARAADDTEHRNREFTASFFEWAAAIELPGLRRHGVRKTLYYAIGEVAHEEYSHGHPTGGSYTLTRWLTARHTTAQSALFKHSARSLSPATVDTMCHLRATIEGLQRRYGITFPRQDLLMAYPLPK